jgi:uncharacterized protein
MDASSAPIAAPGETPLSLIEGRVLGCLFEKELATPEYYPLSLNALVNACNQKSNRDPVLALSAREVEAALDGLRQRRLAGLFAGADARVPKFKHTLDLVYPMETADRVVLCELLLRGPQTSGELRGHCDRLHSFPEVSAVEEALARLAHRPPAALVVRLERLPGQKEARWAQLLTGAPDAPASPAASTPGEPLKVALTLPPEAEARIAGLEAEVARLRDEVAELRRALGG